MKWIAMVAALGLACVAVSGDAIEESDEDANSLDIDIGRLGVINDHTQQIWLKLRSDVRGKRPDDRVQMSSNLRRLVWSYNDLREVLCNDRFMVEKSCGPPYVPGWALETREAVPSLKQLRARQADLEDQVVPFWDAACDRLKKVIAADDALEYCSVE